MGLYGDIWAGPNFYNYYNLNYEKFSILFWVWFYIIIVPSPAQSAPEDPIIHYSCVLFS